MPLEFLSIDTRLTNFIQGGWKEDYSARVPGFRVYKNSINDETIQLKLRDDISYAFDGTMTDSELEAFIEKALSIFSRSA